MSHVGLQRRKDLMGPTADDFDPDRWQTWTPPMWEYLPFYHGQRVCLGRNFAWAVIEYLLCRMFQEFEGVELLGKARMEADRGETMQLKVALNTKPATPVILGFRHG